MFGVGTLLSSCCMFRITSNAVPVCLTLNRSPIENEQGWGEMAETK